ncbi:hypothetical protein [Elizabethkingia miricola]|uniref:hypothetical protein n=1 Tax=Elizabethkingia miricola TaxID=172045 RepID=UPI003892B6B6
MSKKDNKRDKTERDWDAGVIILLSIAITLLIFSILSPYIFTKVDDSGKYIFDANTGVIGDTFGIMNPFIGLIGIVMTFLAFYIQIKANKIQKDQFDTGLKENKLKDIRNEKLNAYYTLDLLSVNLKSILTDINDKGDNILKYYQNLHREPYKSHLLKRTPSRDYSRILEIDRLAIYKGFRFFNVTDQIHNFSRLYNILDFLPEFFQDFYSKAQNFNKESFEKKIDIRNKILEFLNMNANIISSYQFQTYSSIINLSNEVIRINYEIINSSYDEHENPIAETDWQEVDEKLLKYFIIEALQLRETGQFDPILTPIITYASNIRKDITQIKQRAIEFSEEVKTQYDNLLVDGNEKSVSTLLNDLQAEINNSLLNSKLEIDEFYTI